MSETRPDLVRRLRGVLANVISDAKAYEVPDLCRRIGLAEGTEQEAYQSKYKYAQRRISGIGPQDTIEVAKRLAEDSSDYELHETLRKLEEINDPPISEITRRRIIAHLDGVPLSTEMDTIDFIRRVWPISEMPTAFPDFSQGSLEDDLFRHTLRNDDWSNRDLLTHLGLLSCSRFQLGRFLAELVGPTVLAPEKQTQLAESISHHLRHDGYELVVVGKLSGSPVFELKSMKRGSPADSAISATLAAFNPDDVHSRWESALSRRESDPAGAITLARTLLEDVCKWILQEASAPYDDADDLPALYKKLAKQLNLAPDDHTEKVFKQILGSCQSVVESLGALRNKLGDAHSGGPKRARPAPRHAELAVNLSGAMAMFLVATWSDRKRKSGS